MTVISQLINEYSGSRTRLFNYIGFYEHFPESMYEEILGWDWRILPVCDLRDKPWMIEFDSEVEEMYVPQMTDSFEISMVRHYNHRKDHGLFFYMDSDLDEVHASREHSDDYGLVTKCHPLIVDQEQHGYILYMFRLGEVSVVITDPDGDDRWNMYVLSTGLEQGVANYWLGQELT